MNAAVVESFGSAPRYTSFAEPEPRDGGLVVNMRAAALSNLVKGQASGNHYSSGTQLPFVPGWDGVGTLGDGRRVYFFGTRTPYGAMAEKSIVAESRTILLPDRVNDVTAAALGNPGLATWGAMLGRAKLQRGEAVLVNGATGVAGQQAVQVAKYLGASRVIATGRNDAALEKLRTLGADQTISLQQSDERLLTAFRTALEGINVVLDYLWGHSAELLLEAAQGHGAPQGEPRIRYLQIGSISGEAITLKGGVLRSSGLELLGSGLGSLSAAEIVSAMTQMLEAEAAGAGFRIQTEAVALKRVNSAWNRTEAGTRIVFTM